MNILQKIAYRLSPPKSFEQENTQEWWAEAYAKGLHDYLDKNKTAEIARYGIILGFILHNNCKKIADIGSGKGLLAQFLSSVRDIDYVGVDYLDFVVAQAQKNLPQMRFECADARVFLEKDEKFDAIIFNESLYYFDDHEKLFSNAYQKLNTGGIIAVSMFDNYVVDNIWKNLEKISPPTEQVVFRSVLGKEKFKFHLAYWKKP